MVTTTGTNPATPGTPAGTPAGAAAGAAAGNPREKAARTAAVIGATGLIGGHLAELLSADEHFSKVRLITRRTPENTPNGAEVVVIDFEDPGAFGAALKGIDAVFCAVGTTRKKVRGDMDAYRKVDLDIPVNTARHCLENGCRHFSLVSSVGASAKSGNFYLKFKGEAEEAAAGIGLPSAAVFRPSMLMGKRREFRLAEEISKIFASPLSFLFPAKYRPVRGLDVAKAMIAAAKREEPGFRVYHFREMMALIGKQ
ncbi:MAG: NAD(P)H-binding protein [Bacteroidota bacterium]|nr:NAD(P)H-binding protein [Bacteroidota bacterium]